MREVRPTLLDSRWTWCTRSDLTFTEPRVWHSGAIFTPSVYTRIQAPLGTRSTTLLPDSNVAAHMLVLLEHWKGWYVKTWLCHGYDSHCSYHVVHFWKEGTINGKTFQTPNARCLVHCTAMWTLHRNPACFPQCFPQINPSVHMQETLLFFGFSQRFRQTARACLGNNWWSGAVSHTGAMRVSVQCQPSNDERTLWKQRCYGKDPG